MSKGGGKELVELTPNPTPIPQLQPQTNFLMHSFAELR